MTPTEIVAAIRQAEQQLAQATCHVDMLRDRLRDLRRRLAELDRGQDDRPADQLVIVGR
jgi:hypothetical protein